MNIEKIVKREENDFMILADHVWGEYKNTKSYKNRIYRRIFNVLDREVRTGKRKLNETFFSKGVSRISFLTIKYSLRKQYKVNICNIFCFPFVNCIDRKRGSLGCITRGIN